MSLFDPLNPSFATICPSLRVCRGFNKEAQRICVARIKKILSHPSPARVNEVLLEDGLVPVTLDLVLENDLCSFSRSSISAWKSNPVRYVDEMRYFIDVLVLHSESLVRLSELQGRREISQGLRRDTAQQFIAGLPRYRRIWDLFFDLRSSLYGAWTTEFDPITSTKSSPEALALVLAESVASLSGRFRDPTAMSVAQKLCLIVVFIWMHSPVDAHRFRALHWLASYYMDRTEEGPYSMWMKMNKEAVESGSFSSDTLTACIQRDLRDENSIGKRLLTLGSMFFAFRATRIESVTETTPLDLKMFSYMLAAARRNLCRDPVTDTSLSNINFLLMRACDVMVWVRANDPPVPERALLELISILSCAIIRNTGNKTILGRCTSVAPACSRAFRRLRRTPVSPEIKAMRRLTLKLFGESLKRLEPLPRPENPLEDALPAWRLLEADLPRQLPRSVGEFTPPLLKRCGWKRCLCSVHRPAHRMRLCNGCFKVAYCGPQCQTPDWSDGGHKDRCRGVNLV